MINLAGYEITNQIHESNNSLVCRGLRKQDNQLVILKFLKEDYPMPASLVRYKQEYEITRNLNLESVPKTYSLERYQNSLVIIFEDSGGESLKLWFASQKLTLEDFLSTAIKITRALGQIHQHNIIHKDINPSNIIINSTTGLVQIIDFGISTVLSRENPSINNPNILEGTLTYISPEQTGRMNRSIDYRTDFYSLGVTFYELLTGQVPCDYNDAMELVHCHIAKQALPPHEINPEIPKAVSDIVMKLLAKTAEERYQSAWGIIADLEECLQQLQAKGTIVDFAIAQKDITDKFQIPQKLYGREREVETLLAAFERVSNGTTEIMLVSGYSGIGKSALVQEVYKPITKARGYFIAGKFDQFQRNIPYAAIINAFRSLVKQILTESEAQLVHWKEKLLAVLGKNGQVIIDVVPEVELIVGKQPAVPELAPAESQNRFNSVFQKFIGVFCSSEHPLVIFLDDLQWADSATLKLLEVMMTDAQTRYLFLIGAYRDNEVDPGHPLMISLDLLQSKASVINNITLVPLAIEDICNLICDTLHANTITVEQLAQLVIRKTSGNPFFVNQFLKTLYQEGLLTFIPPSQGSKPQWQWDIALIEAIGITDNVVELMVRKLRKLPTSTQQVLQLAACAGNTFDLHTLSLIHETSVAVAYQNLLPAIQEGLVLPISDLETTPEEIIDAPLIILTFKFLHDRVQQAAYATIPEEHKKEVHLKIGQLLLKNTTEEELEEKVFNLVNHLNIGVELIDDLEQKVKLSNLNLIAGKKAKASTAYKTAATYFALGIKLLGIQAWENYYELTFTLYRERSECEYLAGNLEEAEELFKIALSNSKSAIDKAEIYSLYTFFCSTLSRKDEALKFTLAGLECLGMELPRTEEELPKAVEVELQQVSLNLSQRKVADLIHAHELRDLTKRACIKLLIDLWAVAYYVVHQNWLDLSILKIVNMSLRYGNTDLSAFGYVTYGMLLSSRNEYKSAYEFGKLALKLNEKFNNKSLSCKIPNLFALRINPYNNHLKTNLDIFRTAYQGGLECGDLVYIVWTMMFSIWTRFIIGQPLQNVYEESCKYIAVMKQTNDLSMLYGFMSLQQTTLNLQGLTKDKYSFDDETYSEALCLQHWENTKFYHVKTWYITFKAQVLFIYDNYTEALKLAQENEKEINNFGFFNITQHYFYYSLILAAVYSEASIDEKENYWEILHNNLEKTKIWADSCPDNYLHQYLLIAAEIARISGKALEAMDLYDKAIASARENEYIQNEALGNELAAKFWLAKGKEDFAQLYMQKAHYGYQIWGAQRKIDDLEEKYPQLLARTSAKTVKTKINQTTTAPTTTSTNLGDTLDLATVMKASQAISGEIVLSKLLERLMKIAIENAGAEKGFLILEKAGNWAIEAEGSVKEDEVSVLRSLPLNATAASGEMPKLASAIANYVIRTQENVVLNNATQEGQFTRDPYIAATQPKSILCTPLLHQGKLTGILYLENNLTEGAFTTDRLELLKLLSAQIAISIENAQLYNNLQEFNQNLEQLVGDRTHELSNTLDALKAAQSKLVESEKMASLGGLVAGVAHEINTPIGVGVTVASALADHTTEFASIYKSGKMKRSELEEFLDIATQSSNTLLINLNQAAALIQSFKEVAVDRSSEERRTFGVRNYLDEILIQLKPKLRNSKHSIEIKGDSKIALDSYPGALSQVVTNLLMNSLIHAYEPGESGQLAFDWRQEGDRLSFEYSDDGKGISPENLSKIFEPFFTTKRGQGGSGLGLHIVYNLVTQKLLGEIECKSEVGVGTKFIIKFPVQIDSQP
ncbi:ATP-binding sensor histidine kinase [Microcoleus sp. A003_D6]|uniref:trifunctional serine/threonine-protein kinase/ATP-binding protein/sensor histidine kinase n=1 Tax=Microcoleus sp. A003_D6 TaxID=3055266 RepID=UPI002FD5BECE